MGLLIDTLVLVFGLVVVLMLVLLHHARVVAGRLPYRRPLPPLQVLQTALRRGAETGRALHLSPGAGAIGARGSTAETIAGLLAADQAAGEAARSGVRILASSGDAVTHLALRGILRQAYQRAGVGQDYDPGNIELFAHQDPLAYAAGVGRIYSRQQLEASQLVGAFGEEFPLVGESGAERGVPQLAGTALTSGMAQVYLSAQAPLIGEEIYTLDAHLSRVPTPQARLLTHDTLRTLVIILILAGLLYNAVALVIGLPALPLPGTEL